MRRLLAAGMAVALLGVTGCSGDDGGGGEPDLAAAGPLGALARLQSTSESRQYFSYGDVAAVRKLREADSGRFALLLGYGFDELAASSVLIKDGITFDPLAMREAAMAGKPPSYVGYLRGEYDLSAVNEKLTARQVESAKDGEATTWTTGAEGEIDLEDGPFVGVVQTNQFNNIRTEPGSFTYAPTAAALAWATDPGESTLADDPGMVAAANCLGDVVTAAIVRQPDDPKTLYAAGVRAPSATDVTDVICIVTDDASVEKLRAGIADVIQDQNDPRGEQLAGAQVTAAGPAVRMLLDVPADRPPGTVHRLMIDGTLFRLAGEMLG